MYATGTVTRILLLFGSLAAMSQAQQQTTTTPVSIDFKTKRFIGNYDSSFDRTKYINLHDIFHKDFNASELEYLSNSLELNYGRNIGNMHWTLSTVHASSTHPAFPNASELAAEGQKACEKFDKNDIAKPYNTDQVVYVSKVTPLFPNPVTAAANPPPKGFVPSTYQGAAAFLRHFFDNFFASDPGLPGRLRPAYFEVINEPFVKLYKLKSNVTAMNRFHEVVADTLHAAFPKLNVGGPVQAWPDFERNNFAVWTGTMKKFIDAVGAKMDFMSLHLYDAPTGNSTTDRGRLRAGSNAEAILDLIESYTIQRFGQAKPFIVSEYGACCGGEAWQGPYFAHRDWQILKSTNALMLTFLKRQNRIAKTIPFIVGKATWYFDNHVDPYPFVIFHPDGNVTKKGGGSWKPTHLVKWYEFWQGVQGERVAIQTKGDPDIQLEAFLHNQQEGYVYLYNYEFGPHNITLKLGSLAAAEDISEVRVRRLYLDETTQTPVLETDTLSNHPSQLTLKAEESVLLEYVFTKPIVQNDTVWDDRFFAQESLQPINVGQALNFTFQEVLTPFTGAASLRMSIGRPHDLSLQPQVSINGVKVPVPTDWMGYDQLNRNEFFGMIEVPFDVSLLSSETKVNITFPDSGGHVAAAVLSLTSPRISLTAVLEKPNKADVLEPSKEVSGARRPLAQPFLTLFALLVVGLALCILY